MHAGVDFAVQAFRLGASGYVLKVDASGELARAIKEALAGRLYITPSIAKDVMMVLMEDRKAPAGDDEEPWTALTSREREVLQLVAEGHKMAEIGEILHISPRTVERHKYNLMDKLKLRTTAELTQYAIKRGIISQP
jgi:DNA-binding NarL/FixJ family response regulator